MQARMKNPMMILPDALQALRAVDKASEEQVPYVTRKLMHLRASQINGCSVCVNMHARELKKTGESDERIFSVAAWRDTPFFTDAERAARKPSRGSAIAPIRYRTTSGTRWPRTTIGGCWSRKASRVASR